MNTHYSQYSIDPDLLARTGKIFYDEIRNIYPKERVLIAYKGFSGSSLGSAILTVAGINDDQNISGFYLRKTGEKSHSSNLAERNLEFLPEKFIIVDDFVASGNSIKSLIRALKLMKYEPKEFILMFFGIILPWKVFSLDEDISKIFSARLSDHIKTYDWDNRQN